MLTQFKETDIDSVGDFRGEEKEAVAIIDSILEKIEEEVGDKEITNTHDIANRVFEHVWDYPNPFPEDVEEDVKKTVELIMPFVETFESEAE